MGCATRPCQTCARRRTSGHPIERRRAIEVGPGRQDGAAGRHRALCCRVRESAAGHQVCRLDCARLPGREVRMSGEARGLHREMLPVAGREAPRGNDLSHWQTGGGLSIMGPGVGAECQAERLTHAVLRGQQRSADKIWMTKYDCFARLQRHARAQAWPALWPPHGRWLQGGSHTSSRPLPGIVLAKTCVGEEKVNVGVAVDYAHPGASWTRSSRRTMMCPATDCGRGLWTSWSGCGAWASGSMRRHSARTR
jgi:hypothetical protein